MDKLYTKAMAVKNFNRLAEPVEEKLYRLALLSTSSVAWASQLASEALVQVYIRLADAPVGADLRTWMWQTGADECLRMLRKERNMAARAMTSVRNAS